MVSATGTSAAVGTTFVAETTAAVSVGIELVDASATGSGAGVASAATVFVPTVLGALIADSPGCSDSVGEAGEVTGSSSVATTAGGASVETAGVIVVETSASGLTRAVAAGAASAIVGIVFVVAIIAVASAGPELVVMSGAPSAVSGSSAAWKFVMTRSVAGLAGTLDCATTGSEDVFVAVSAGACRSPSWFRVCSRVARAAA